jgi:S1-C subfamily serine protease
VSVLDVVLLALGALSAIGGYRRGAILQAFGLLGLAVGVALALLVVPSATDPIDGVVVRMGVAVGVVMLGAAAGNVIGWLAGSRVRARLAHPHAARTDALLGSGLSVAALVLTTWFLALNLASGPFPQLSAAIGGSRVVRLLDETLPAPPPLLRGLERAAALLGFPDAFVGLPPVPTAPVDDPDPAVVSAAADAAIPSTFVILGDGCASGYLSEGSGFVAAPGYLVTNAHVVAGTTRQAVLVGEDHVPASVVAFDARLDIAVLRVADLQAPPLEFATEELPRGTGGAVLGFPGGPPVMVSSSAVRAVMDAVGRDIYGSGEIRRRLYELQTEVHPGSSGGPFVLVDGQVAAVIFASSTLDEHVAYAIAAAQITPVLARAIARTQPVGTGPCLE